MFIALWVIVTMHLKVCLSAAFIISHSSCKYTS